MGQNLRDEKDVLQRNLFLVSLKQDIKLNLLFDDINVPASSSEGLRDFYKELEFNSFIGENSEKRKSEYKTIKNKSELEKLQLKINEAEYFAFDTETTSINSLEAELVGASFSVKKDEGFYIPINHVEQTEMSANELIEWLKHLLETCLLYTSDAADD